MDILRIFLSLSCIICTSTAENAESSLEKFKLAPQAAKTVLRRVKRGWWPWERREEREEREEDREAQQRERAREAQARLARVCPTSCWNSFGAFGACSQPCGGGGVKTQTRSAKSAQQLGECKDWVAKNGCPGNNRRTAACNRFCRNKGTPTSSGCTCKAGWKDQCCATRITCPNPGKPTNGLTTPSGTGLHYGTTVRFSCNTGYTLAGPTSRQCVGKGTWTNSVPKCNIIRCHTPPTPTHGTLRFVSGNSYVYRSSVKATCNRGYQLRGTAVRSCGANGRWSGSAPSCARIYCPSHTAPANGKVVYQGGRTLDSEAKYTCNTGFYLRGASVRKCQSNKQWTGTLPSCQGIKCTNVAAPSNGLVTHESSSGGKTNFGKKARFSCKRGYVLRGASSITCSGTGAQGTWSAARPTCQPASCGDPGTPANGVKSGNVFTLGGTVSFKCAPGYRLSGARSLTCGTNGRWSASKPQCLKCGANSYKSGTNTATSCAACPSHSSTSGATGATSSSSCICSTGYKGAPGGPCTRITCPALPSPQNAMRKACSNTFGGKCTFECKGGHVVSRGDVMRTCQGAGVWSGGSLVCTACPVNTYKSAVSQCSTCPPNSGTSGPGNEKSGCKCKTGWSGPNGGPCTNVNECSSRNGGCQQQCIDTAGSYRCECNLVGYIKDADDHKKCNSKNQCSVMPRPSNGGLVCHSHRHTNTERCQVTCNSGYEHALSPNAFEVCGPSTNWKWSHEISDKPILDCVEAYFEELQLELEVFYFASACSGLTSAQKEQMRRQFTEFLVSQGLCRAGGDSICNIDDVRIECSAGNRKKRDTMERIKISFKLKSMAKSKSKMNNCNAACESSYMARTRSQLMAETQKAKIMLVLQTGARPNHRERVHLGNGPHSRIRPITPPTRSSPIMTLGGISLFSSSVSQGSVTSACAGNMVKAGNICATCPPGSYKVQSRGECSLCPVGSYQLQAGKMMCRPCRTASSKGSKSC